MITTELDAIIAAGVGADVNPEFFTELKANLLKCLILEGNADLPIYADNATAITGGLTAGDLYRTASGQLMIVYTPE